MTSLRSNGFTIVELLVSIAIGALFIGAVATLITNNSRVANRGRDIAAANSFAENKFETLRSVGYLGITEGSTDITSELPAELKAPRSASMAISSPSTSIKKVVVAVAYNDQGTQRTYSYTSYIGELGVGQY